MIGRLALFATVLAALLAALAGGFLSDAPAGRAPGYALGASLVWHVEIAVVLFVALYSTIVTLRLAFHGLTFTHLGARGIDIPQLRMPNGEGDDVQESVNVLSASIDHLDIATSRMGRRLDELADAHYLLLQRTRRGI